MNRRLTNRHRGSRSPARLCHTVRTDQYTPFIELSVGEGLGRAWQTVGLWLRHTKGRLLRRLRTLDRKIPKDGCWYRRDQHQQDYLVPDSSDVAAWTFARQDDMVRPNQHQLGTIRL